VIVAHISNRHLDLAPVVANVARSQGLVSFLREDDRAGDFMTTFVSDARVVAMAREVGDTGSVAKKWAPLHLDPASALWTDDYSNVLGIILRQKFGG
jgi:hypothetical protein